MVRRGRFNPSVRLLIHRPPDLQSAGGPASSRLTHRRHADQFADGVQLCTVLYVLRDSSWPSGRYLQPKAHHRGRTGALERVHSQLRLCNNFQAKFLLGMGVGVGEAALSPAAYSLITDYFPRDRLATAVSVYSMGIYLGSGLAYLLGGLVVAYASTQAMWTIPLLGAVHPWQIIF